MEKPAKPMAQWNHFKVSLCQALWCHCLAHHINSYYLLKYGWNICDVMLGPYLESGFAERSPRVSLSSPTLQHSPTLIATKAEDTNASWKHDFWKRKAAKAACFYSFATNSCKWSLTSVSAMRSLSSCKLLVIRALLFFSTSGFLACQRNRSSGSPSLRSMVNSWNSALTNLLTFLSDSTPSSLSAPSALLRAGAMLTFEPAAVCRGTRRRSVNDPESRYRLSGEQMARRPPKLAGRLGSFTASKGHVLEYICPHLHMNDVCVCVW